MNQITVGSLLSILELPVSMPVAIIMRTDSCANSNYFRQTLLYEGVRSKLNKKHLSLRVRKATPYKDRLVITTEYRTDI